MVKLFIDLVIEMIDFNSKDFETTFKKIKSYKYYLTQENFNILDELYTRIIKIKGDWISLDCSYLQDTIIAKYYLIFHSNKLSPSDTDIINQILLTIDEFFKEKKLAAIDMDEPSLSQDIQKSGYILCLTSGRDLDNNEIESLLKQKNISFKILNKHIHRFDGGCNNESTSIIYYIASPIISTILGEIIKKALSSEIEVGFIENLKFNSLKKTIASRTKQDIRSLALKEMYRTEKEIKMIFFSTDKEIIVICDPNYKIKKLTVKDIV